MVILFSLAHPDDESFGAAGLACRYAAEGATIVLVTATRGQAGKMGDPPRCTREELPAVREVELREAAAILGIATLQLLDYRDGELAGAPADRLRQDLVAAVRRHRPQIVFTFDPNGYNGHPDHVAISRSTADAVAAAADSRWLPECGEAWHVPRLLWTSPLAPWDAARSSNLVAEPGLDFLLDISPWADRKAAALRAHRTQHLSIDRCFFSQPDVDRILRIETFRQGFGPRLRQPPSTDIFEGL
jgi:N-acetylglucosamine malate deacetylase 2